MQPKQPGILQQPPDPNMIPEQALPPAAEPNILKEMDMSKIGDQAQSQTDTPSMVDEAMSMIDSAMGEIQNSPDPKVAIETLCDQLKLLVGTNGTY
jgi:hypothetical protein